ILYAHAVKSAPKNVLAIDHLANELYKRGQVDMALQQYEEALRLKPDSWETRFAVGITRYEIGQFAAAQKELETAIPLLPSNADQYYYLGLCHLQQGQYARAEQSFRMAIAIFGAKPGFHYALARSLEKQGKLEKARDELRAEWRINPNSQVKMALEALEKPGTPTRP
ncbi:MAG: tetratricopeptide repeat protein, partial [Terriglobales bacterium]